MQRLQPLLTAIQQGFSAALAWLVRVAPSALRYGGIAIVGTIAIVGGVALAIVGSLVGAFILAIPALAIALQGFYVGGQTYWRTLQTSHETAYLYTERHPPKPPKLLIHHRQPSHLMYFFDEAWRVAALTIREVWKPTRQAVDQWWMRAQYQRDQAINLPRDARNFPRRMYHLILATAMVIGGAFFYIAMSIVVGLGTLLHVTINLFGALLSALLIPLLGASNRINEALFRINYRCPHPNCHAHMVLPIFICPQCGEQHTRLRPSIYGIFYHRCTGPEGGTCGYRLPTLERLGRRGLSRQCPTCHRPLPNAIGQATDVHLPIMGGPAVGKSYFLTALSDVLQTSIGPAHGVGVSIPDEAQAEQLRINKEQLESGGRLMKTSDADTSVGAINLQLVGKRGRVPQLWYVYDAAGEHYGSSDRTLQQNYFEYVRGIFFLIDPFSLDEVASQYKDQLADAKAISPSTEPPEHILNRAFDALRLYAGNKDQLPVAIILTKADAFDLDEQVGEAAARRLMARFPAIRTQADAIDILVQHYLAEHGGTNIMMQLRNHFANVRFFSMAVVEDGQYKPQRVDEPLQWMLSQTGLIDARNDRIKAIDVEDQTRQRRASYRRLDQLRYYVWDSLSVPAIQPQDITRENV